MPEQVWNNKQDRFDDVIIKRRQSHRATRSRQTRYDPRHDAFLYRGVKEWGIEHHRDERGVDISWPEELPLPPNRFIDAENIGKSLEEPYGVGVQHLMFYPPAMFMRDLPSTVLTVDEVRQNLHLMKKSTVPMNIVQFKLFDKQPEIIEHRVTMMTRDSLIAAIGKIVIAYTTDDAVNAILKGEDYIEIDLPAPKINNRCRLHLNCRGHFSEDSFRDNLR